MLSLPASRTHGLPPLAVALALLVAGCNTTPDVVACYTPLVLSFDGAAVAYVAGQEGDDFDLGQHDPGVTTDWPTAKTPWLARDIDGNGRIDDGTELFGSDTRTANGSAAKNGFQALDALDSNGDGRIDAADAAWSSVLVWRDANADRSTEAGELTSAQASGITWIGIPGDGRWTGAQGSAETPLSHAPAQSCDDRGNCVIARSAFAYVDGTGHTRLGAVLDVNLRAYRLPVGDDPIGGEPSYSDVCQ